MTCYSVVINNPTETDEGQIAAAKQAGWRVVGQLEKGDNGTPHYQLCVTAPVEWKTMKSHFTRANIQEAEDPEALEKYCQKKATRVLDLTDRKQPNKKKDAYSSEVFYNDVFAEAYEQNGEGTDELINKDDNLLTYDAAVNQLILTKGYSVAVRATRPDVRSAYRKYRYAMWSVWHNDNIDIEHNQDADEDEGSEQATGVLGRQHEDDEGVSEGEEDTEREDDSDSQQDSEASDSESD